MSVKTLIQEAINKNALGFEEALKEELRDRIALALEAKMNGESGDEDEESDDSDDSDEDHQSMDDDESEEDDEDKK